VPWNLQTPPGEQREAFVALLAGRTCSFAEACARFGISRKTGYKWRQRAASPQPQPLLDRPRRPRHCPGRIPPQQERRILEVRDLRSWGARKIHASLRQQGQEVPSARTVHAALARNGRVAPRHPAPPPRPFERPIPNELWQIDYKGPLRVEGKSRYLLSVLDDHSRYALALALCPDQTMATAWPVLWDLFGGVGLPEAILSDNGFAPRGPAAFGLSWLEARLSRLGVLTPHGRPYHPQTQGKVERWHRTLGDELFGRLDWSSEAKLVEQIERWRRDVYNAQRPHEALGYAAPASRWYASARPRPGRLPAVTYPAGMETRKVMQKGEVSWRGTEILVGAGLYGERVGVQERDGEVVLLYGQREIRRLKADRLREVPGH
jgi:transposase InsO family protein